MSLIDWAVLFCTLLSIVAYGIYKSRGNQNMDGYLLGNRSLPWYHIGLSVMATQASAITFLSAPGLAYTSGMSFAQFYFGVPLAMIVLSITFVPIFHRLGVYTAYEYLEQRFDVKTRAFTAALFLIQRGLSTGITIYAPSVILSSILQIDASYTTLFIGSLVVLYTVYGGTKAVSHTQLLQMAIIFIGLLCAGLMVIHLLPKEVGLVRALHLAGKSGKANAIDFSWDLNNQYTLWSGLIGGFFLQLSYFGTDQSQVGRYLTGASIRESRLGLLMNGLIKVPMQFLILLIGLLVFTFYQYQQPPLFFNRLEEQKIEQSPYQGELKEIRQDFYTQFQKRKGLVEELNQALDKNQLERLPEIRQALQQTQTKTDTIRKNLTNLMQKNDPQADLNDNNYIFLRFVTEYMPRGLIGLLIAIIFLASMGSTASALNSLASTTVVDIYKRFIHKTGSDENYLNSSRLATLFWGVVSIAMALYASKLGNLLEAVNILGSLFYGTILGIFLVAFYMKRVGGTATFWAAILTEIGVFICWKWNVIAFLWLNLIGCLFVMGFAWLFHQVLKSKNDKISG